MKIDPFPGTLTKQPLRHNSMGYVLTDEQRAWLCKWFPEEENSRLMAASGMSHSTLHRFAREFSDEVSWQKVDPTAAAAASGEEDITEGGDNQGGGNTGGSQGGELEG